MNTIAELTQADLLRVVDKLGLLKGVMEQGCIFVGGGFIRDIVLDKEPQDVDLFVSSKLEAAIFRDIIRGLLGEPEITETENAITIKPYGGKMIQIITRWLFSDAESLIRSFDFTVCQCAVWVDMKTGTFRSAVSPTFYADLADKRLVYTFPVREEKASGSFMRVIKLVARGWKIHASSLTGVLARLMRDVPIPPTEKEMDTYLYELIKREQPRDQY